jgi:hypothetical protein
MYWTGEDFDQRLAEMLPPEPIAAEPKLPPVVASGGYQYSGHDNQDAKEVIAEHEAERIFRLEEAA